MANVQLLAASARAIKARSDQSVGWKLAAIKAVEASGVTHKPDVKRISEQVVIELRKQGVISTQSTSRTLKRVGGYR